MKIRGLIKENIRSKVWEVNLDVLLSTHEIEVIEHITKRLKSSIEDNAVTYKSTSPFAATDEGI